jgi:hypothetical protein
MANSKISALTSATTPLAGTEVLPIVQSGATVKVANNDLRPKQIQSNATSGVLQIAGPATASTRVMTTPDANFTVARIDAAQSFIGNQTLSTGNLIQGTSAKGINFTANTPAAGKTSQLLNWYEEGTWTPSDNSGAGLSFTSVTGIYTRVGRLVTCTFGLTFPTTASVAGVSIGGLPFTSLSSGTPNPSGGSITYTGAAVTAAGFAVGSGGTSVALYGASGAALTNATFSSFILRAQFTYTVN